MFLFKYSLRIEIFAIKIHPFRHLLVFVFLVLYSIQDLIDSLCPVSYTHLRAHETVLDLVCRLLLEKKNIYKTLYHTTV